VWTDPTWPAFLAGLVSQHRIGRIAKDVTIWMAARNDAKPSAYF
jgi:hypothetical protein